MPIPSEGNIGFSRLESFLVSVFQLWGISSPNFGNLGAWRPFSLPRPSAFYVMPRSSFSDLWGVFNTDTSASLPARRSLRLGLGVGWDLAVGRLFLVNSSSLWGKRVRLQTRGTAGKETRGQIIRLRGKNSRRIPRWWGMMIPVRQGDCCTGDSTGSVITRGRRGRHRWSRHWQAGNRARPEFRFEFHFYFFWASFEVWISLSLFWASFEVGIPLLLFWAYFEVWISLLLFWG